MRIRAKRLYRVRGLFSEGLSPQYEKGRDFQTKKAAEHYAQILLFGFPEEGGLPGEEGRLSQPAAIHVTIQVSDLVKFTGWPTRYLPKETR